jgi:hypothetical protein
MQTVVIKNMPSLPLNLSHQIRRPNFFGDWFNTKPSLIIPEKECTPTPTIIIFYGPPFPAILAWERSTVRHLFIMALGFLISALILPVAASIDHIHDPDWRAFKSKFRKTLRSIAGRENCMCCCRIRGYLYHCIREFSPNMIQRWAVLVA